MADAIKLRIWIWNFARALSLSATAVCERNEDRAPNRATLEPNHTRADL